MLCISLRTGAGPDTAATPTPVRSDDYSCGHGTSTAWPVEKDADDAAAAPEEIVEPRAFRQLHDRGRCGAPHEHLIQRLPPDRKRIADVSRILGRSNLRRGVVDVCVLASQRRSAQREQAIEHTKAPEDRNRVTAAEEVRGEGRARKGRPVYEQHPNARITQQRSQSRARNACPDDDDVDALGRCYALGHDWILSLRWRA